MSIRFFCLVVFNVEKAADMNNEHKLHSQRLASHAIEIVTFNHQILYE